MGSEWPLITLGEFIELQTGFPFKSETYSDTDGVKLLRGDNIGQNLLRWDNVKRLPQELIGAKETTYFLNEGDVILAMDRPWIEAGLKTAQVIKTDLPCLLVQRVACLRALEQSDQDFLRYLISSNSFTQYVKLVQTGTAVPHISPKQIKDYQFKKPPKKIRVRIGKIIRTLDNKITINRQINQTLEQMAQTLFKSWFVDFDPVIDNALDAGNDIPDTLQERAEQRRLLRAKADFKPLPAETRALFPSEFEETELGWVPKGWEVCSLPELFDFKEGPGIRNWQYTNSDAGTKFINIRCIQDGDITLTTANRISDEEANGKYLHFHLEEWDIVLSASGTLGRCQGGITLC